MLIQWQSCAAICRAEVLLFHQNHVCSLVVAFRCHRSQKRDVLLYRCESPDVGAIRTRKERLEKHSVVTRDRENVLAAGDIDRRRNGHRSVASAWTTKGGLTNRSLLSRCSRFIVKLQGIQSLLTILCRVGFVGSSAEVHACAVLAETVLHLIGLFLQLVPLVLSGLFTSASTVLELVVILRTIIEELWIDFHEKLHGVVHHAVYCSASVSII